MFYVQKYEVKRFINISRRPLAFFNFLFHPNLKKGQTTRILKISIAYIKKRPSMMLHRTVNMIVGSFKGIGCLECDNPSEPFTQGWVIFYG